MRQVLLTVLVLLSATVAATAPVVSAQDEGLAPDGLSVHVGIEEDGDARWTVATSYDVNESADRRAFEDVAAEFERGQGDLGFSLGAFERVVPEVSERTGRDMAIREPRWTSAIENESGGQLGYLRLSFTWTNFAAVDNESVSIDGTFDGGWFGDLEAGQTLTVRPPPGFDVSSAQPSHETVNGTLRWTGPVDFGPNEPVATFERRAGLAAIPWPSIAGAVVTALVIGGILAYTWLWRREGDAVPPWGGSSDVDEVDATSGGSTNGGGVESTPEATSTAGAERAADAAAAATGGLAAETTDPDAGAGAAVEPEPELLSDEERVERLLSERGGRMKQAKIVEETRWSNAKVSQLLSQMADEGRVEKLRIGRENLISLPEDESTAED